MESTLIKPFKDLAAQTVQQWKLKNYEPDAFCGLAEKGLSQFEARIPNFDGLLQLILQDELQVSDRLNETRDTNGMTNELILCLASNDRVRIELSIGFANMPEIRKSSEHRATKVLRGKALVAEYEVEAESDQEIGKARVEFQGITSLLDGEIFSRKASEKSYFEVCRCNDPMLSLSIVANSSAKTEGVEAYSLLPNFIFNTLESLPSEMQRALRLILSCDKAGGESKAASLYQNLLRKMDDAEIIFHHRNSIDFMGIPWITIRLDEINSRPWGKTFKRAEEYEREYKINFMKIKDPVHRAMAFILQRDGAVESYEKLLREDLGMQQSLKENSIQLIDSLSEKQVYRKRIDKTSTEFLRFAVEGVSPSRMKEEIQQQFNIADEKDSPINVDQYFKNIESDPIFRRLVKSHGKSN